MEKTKKSIFKKWWFWLIVIVVVIGVASQGGDDKKAGEKESEPASAKVENGDDKPKETPKEEPKKEDPKPEEEVIQISAVDLYKAYKENEVAADNKYKGKQLEISGVVADIGKDILDKAYVTLDTGEMLGSVQVYFKKDQLDKLAELKKEQDLTIIGKGNGFLLNALIKDAVIK